MTVYVINHFENIRIVYLGTIVTNTNGFQDYIWKKVNVLSAFVSSSYKCSFLKVL
jgi:hypothetical protein